MVALRLLLPVPLRLLDLSGSWDGCGRRGRFATKGVALQLPCGAAAAACRRIACLLLLAPA